MESFLFQFGLNYIQTNLATEKQRDDFLKNLDIVKKKLVKKIEEAEKKVKDAEEDAITELPNLDTILK